LHGSAGGGLLEFAGVLLTYLSHPLSVFFLDILSRMSPSIMS